MFFNPTLAQNSVPKVEFSLFLIGDAGEPDTHGKDAVLNTLSAKLKLKGKIVPWSF
jgi:hypothetical protein